MREPNSQTTPSDASTSGLLVNDLIPGLDRLTDTQILSTLLAGQDRIARAEEILHQTNGLSGVFYATPMELQALGLRDEESVRVLIHFEATKRAIERRLKGRLDNYYDVIRLIRVRGEELGRPYIGFFLVDSDDCILVDRILCEGPSAFRGSDANEMFRDALRTGADGVMAYRWTPAGEVKPNRNDTSLGDTLLVSLQARTMAATRSPKAVPICASTWVPPASSAASWSRAAMASSSSAPKLRAREATARG